MFVVRSFRALGGGAINECRQCLQISPAPFPHGADVGILGDLVPANHAPAIWPRSEVPVPDPGERFTILARDAGAAIKKLGIVAGVERCVPALAGGMNFIAHFLDLCKRLRVPIRVLAGPVIGDGIEHRETGGRQRSAGLIPHQEHTVSNCLADSEHVCIAVSARAGKRNDGLAVDSFPGGLAIELSVQEVEIVDDVVGGRQ